VTANVAPKLMYEMCAAALNGEVAKAREINFRLLGLHRNLFVESSPAPTKYACSLLGLCSEEVRLPIIPCSDGAKTVIRAAMTQAGLI